jgi:hypothetical protein
MTEATEIEKARSAIAAARRAVGDALTAMQGVEVSEVAYLPYKLAMEGDLRNVDNILVGAERYRDYLQHHEPGGSTIRPKVTRTPWI